MLREHKENTGKGGVGGEREDVGSMQGVICFPWGMGGGNRDV